MHSDVKSFSMKECRLSDNGMENLTITQDPVSTKFILNLV
jgi:hypothetical protein